ncbi:MAG: hypothetical protein J6Z22_03565 [Lachnospiraceae bacterium]|nr:hypothetical protein [Lachnospiraceae bacterium]
MGYVIGGIIGFVLAIGTALYVTMTLVKRSNDIGDSKGSLKDFGFLNTMVAEDDLHNCRPSARGKIILNENCQKEEKSL